MREIAESKDLLERRLGRPVRHLAYPFGDASAVGSREFRLARQAGYVTAITSRPEHIFPDHAAHPHASPHTSVNGLFQNTRALRATLRRSILDLVPPPHPENRMLSRGV
jgi:peptidoglycan/xylan/chitin deacetylase (PgdA/CDA1 family)